MVTDRILRIAKRLQLPIPAPYVPPPRAQDSFRTLKTGQFLTNVPLMSWNAKDISAGSLWQVVSVDSQGAVLGQFNLVTVSVTPEKHAFKIKDKEWKDTGYWKRARKPTKAMLKAAASGASKL